ncbi:mediator of RNA polymerase II transcription subunit 16 [Phthorimaea operculella]|nr:mediator of RNA polymerase II transcription subunit 16 [Phthorimaea operculella]
MELIYSMRRKSIKCEPPHFERATDPEIVRPICTISCTNTIAFSSPTELSDTDCDTWGGHVYVCDLDTPWDSHKVVSTAHSVSALEWDGEGKHLLVATTEGDVSVFGQKDFLLNEWICIYSASFPGEHIVKATFFHNGRRLVALDKKHDAPITDKIQALRSTPTLKGFGGVPVAGACVISATGLVGALTADASSKAADSLRAHRDHVTQACFSHKNGNLLIAAVCVSGTARACVRCCVCTITRTGAPPSLVPALSLTPLPTLVCVNIPTCITWCLRDDTDSLLVAGTTLALWKLTDRQHQVHKLLSKDSLLVAGTTLALWKLTDRQHQVHKLLSKGMMQGGTTPGGGQKPATDCFNTVAWPQAAVWALEANSQCTSVASGRLAVGAPLVVLATPRKLHLLSRDKHHLICSRVVMTNGPDTAAASPPKKPKYGNGHNTNASGSATVSSVDISWLNGVVVAVDTRAQLHVYKLAQPWAELPAPMSVQHATTVLEFSLVSGYDALDVLLTLKPAIIEQVYERLTETFQRQPAPFQQYYFHSWLKMRIALCRLLPTAASTVSWLTCVSTLWGLWSVCQSALRPDDKPDDKPLQALLDNNHTDHVQALIALESKAELPSETQVLVALRRPLQRAVDIAVTALAAAAHHPNTQGHHGYELWADPVGISLLRKLVVLARGAGIADSALSRLLARLHQPAKPDTYEECNALSALYPARVWEALPRTAVSAPHGKHPLYLEYGVEPENLRVSPEPPPAAHTDHTPASNMDCIRYMYLCGGGKWRACCRCGGRALPHPNPTRHPLQRAHDARFLPNCRCGGKWTLVSII